VLNFLLLCVCVCRHRINDTRCMFCRKGHCVSSYSCDSSVHGLPNVDSDDDITLSSDDFPVNTSNFCVIYPFLFSSSFHLCFYLNFLNYIGDCKIKKEENIR
jgi:hypothetical protein